jgi:CSLREA domain-containing protein
MNSADRGRWISNALCLLGAALLFTLIAAPSAIAAPFTVTKTADTNDGSCDGDCSLREAISAANLAGPSTITVPAGTYTLTIDTLAADQDDANAEGDLDITGTVTITGAGPGHTIIDGNGPNLHDHVIQVVGTGNATISGVTVQNGHSTDEGGGRDDGGGIHVEDLATLSLSNALLTNNVAGASEGYGGGLDVDGKATVSNVTISNNSALGGGGGGEVEGSASLANVTVSGNRANRDGGGLDLDGDTTSLNNVTLAGNTADSDGDDDGEGGGVFVDPSTGETVNFANTIVAGNTDASLSTGSVSPDCGQLGPVNSQGYNLLRNATGGCTFGGPGDKTNVDPLLGPLADNGGGLPTHAITGSSPAFNAGNPAAPGSSPAACATTDERGIPRPQSSACDIGAFELTQCRGRTATIVGTNGPDKLKGTKRADVIAAFGGKDKVSGLKGNDVICGGPGKDKLNGGKGNDKLYGEAGKDTLKGGPGKDKLKGGPGKDKQIQ